MNFGDIDGDAFRVSLQVTLLATFLCVVVGLPLTWWTWRSGGSGRKWTTPSTAS